jgi:tetratricopeptide (TPR) repeat protein
LVSFFVLLSFNKLWAAPPAAPLKVTVTVVNANRDPVAPVQNAVAKLTYISSSRAITASLKASNRDGEAVLEVPREAASRGDLRIEISGASGLVVYQPNDGQLQALPYIIKVALLPKGSPLLLKTPAQIEAILHRLNLQTKEQSGQIRQLKGELAQANAAAQRPDLDTAVAAWAQENGFDPAEINKRFTQWSKEIESNKEEEASEKRALAELYLKHYDAAAEIFDQLGDKQRQEFLELEKRQQEEAHNAFQKNLDTLYQNANALEMKLAYHRATEKLGTALAWAAEAHRKYPEDLVYRQIWIDAAIRHADAEMEEAQIAEEALSRLSFARAVEEYRKLLPELTALGDREERARVQNNLGIALTAQGERSQGEAAAALFAQAVPVYRAALEVYTKADLPQDWARTQGNLGITLRDQGLQSQGEAATALFAQAVAAYRAAQEVHTKAEMPQDWAGTQVNLGNLLSDQGERSSGAEARRLDEESITTYRAALEVYTKADQPQYWATAQSGLGDVLHDLGKRSQGKAATAFLAQAVVAHRAALEVRTKEALPYDWALTQSGLGIALDDQGRLSQDETATALFAQSVVAHRAALEVYTKADLPQDWAQTQNNLGIALDDQGERSQGEAATALFAQAVSAYRAALEVRTKEALPVDWAQTQSSLGIALLDQGERSQGEAATALIVQAVAADHAALDVYTKADLPQDWARTQNNLGIALLNQGEHSQGEAATALFAQAVSAYRAALEVRTKEALPKDWAQTQNNLGNALLDQGERSQGEAATALFSQAVAAYRAALEVYTKADLPQDWAQTQNNLGVALDDQGERSQGEAATALFSQAVAAYHAALEVRTKEALPKDWTQTQNNLGNALFHLGDFSAAANAYESVLEISPEDNNILQVVVVVYHEKLFNFDRALEFAARAFKVDPSPENRLDLVEAELTASRFTNCIELSQSLKESELEAKLLPVSDVLKLGCQWGAGKIADARATSKKLEGEAASLQKSTWSTEGDRHYLATAPAFERGRAAWIALFQSLEDGDGKAMAAALRQLDEGMKN